MASVVKICTRKYNKIIFNIQNQDKDDKIQLFEDIKCENVQRILTHVNNMKSSFEAL